MNKPKKIGAIIFSRMGSYRLPGKALMKLGDKPLLSWPIDALRDLSNVEIVVATTKKKQDLAIVNYLKKRDIHFFRGDSENVAKRAIECCDKFGFDYFFRINGDSPLLNIKVLQEAITHIENNDYDLVTNLILKTYPYGVSCELIKTATLKRLYPKFSLSEREHITSFYYKNLKQITFAQISDLNISMRHIRWTIDNSEDLATLNNFLNCYRSIHLHKYEINELIDLYLKYTKKHQ